MRDPPTVTEPVEVTSVGLKSGALRRVGGLCGGNTKTERDGEQNVLVHEEAFHGLAGDGKAEPGPFQAVRDRAESGTRAIASGLAGR